MGKKYRVILVTLSAIIIVGAFLLFPSSRGILVTALVPKIKQEHKEAAFIKEKQSLKLLFVGDIMLDRHIREAAKRQKTACYPFTQLTDFLNSFDVVIGNNEGAITNNISLSANTIPGEKNNYLFTFDPSVIECYLKNNIKIVSLGNNHSLNFGKKGMLETVSNLSSAGVAFFGNPLDEKQNTLVKKVGDYSIAFVSYNYAFGLKSEVVNTQIASLKRDTDYVFVYAHWGNEYVTTANALQRSIGRGFVDSGADAVIGTHPHVIQDSEEYNGKHIYYSLGNFIFDQYFSQETMQGMGIEIIIDPKNPIKIEKYFFENKKNGQVILSENSV